MHLTGMVAFSSRCNFVVAFFWSLNRIFSNINHDHLEIHVVPQGFPARQTELPRFDQSVLDTFDGAPNRAFVHFPIQAQMMMRAILAPELQGQDELIIQIECWTSTLFGFLGFTFLKDRSHVVIRVWFHTEGSAEDGSGKAENSSGEGLHG